MAMMYCPYCGQPILDGTIYCAHCGKVLRPTSVKNDFDYRRTGKPRRHGCLSIALRILLLILLFLFVVGSCSESARSSEEAFDQYMQGVYGGDPKKLEGLFVSEIVARQRGQNDFDIRDSIHVEDIPAKLAEQYGLVNRKYAEITLCREYMYCFSFPVMIHTLMLSGICIMNLRLKEARGVIQKWTF